MKMFSTSGFVRSLYHFPALYSKYRKQIKFWYHFKGIIFLSSLLLSGSISKEQHCNNGYLPVVTSWVKSMDTTENCFVWQQTSDVNEQIKLFFILRKGTTKENYLHSMQCKATMYIFIAGMTQPVNLKSCRFFATFVRWSPSYKSKPQIHWNTDDVHIQAITRSKCRISISNLCAVLFFFPFYVLQAQLGKKTHMMFYFHHAPCNQLWEELGKTGGRECR